MFKVLHWYIKNQIGFLELSNPPSNPMDPIFFEEFYWWRTEIVEKENVEAIVIHGKGRHFSSGAVLNDLLGIISRSHTQEGDINKISKFLNKNSQIFYSLKELNIPVIAAVRGVCLGSAFELALCCDYIICGEKAVLGLPETTFGLIPGCTGTYILPKLVGESLAMELILTGDTFTPFRAKEWGLVQEIVPTKEVLKEATKLAKKFGKNFNHAFKSI